MNPKGERYLMTIPFEPDVLTSGQYADLHRPSAVMPEKRLMLAVLEDAIDAYRGASRVSGRHAEAVAGEAWDWISSDDTTWPFSFVRICEVFDIDPDYVRAGLTAWVARGGEKSRSGVRYIHKDAPISVQAELDVGERNPLYAVGRKRGSCEAQAAQG